MAAITKSIVPFIVGAAVPVLAQQTVGWWLDSGRGVAIVSSSLVVLAVIFAVLRPADGWRQALALALGSFAASAALLAWTGPGTIWPIVLVVAAMLLTLAALLGASAAYGARTIAARHR
jgi:hypothetical protein